MNTYKKSVLAIGLALSLAGGSALAATSSSTADSTVNIVPQCNEISTSGDSGIAADVFNSNTLTLNVSSAYSSNITGTTMSASFTTFANDLDSNDILDSVETNNAAVETVSGVAAYYRLDKSDTITLSNLHLNKAGDFTTTMTITCTLPG